LPLTQPKEIKSKPNSLAETWFADRGWTPFPFQKESWEAYLSGYSGLVNAPTGSGKTYSLIIPILLEFIRQNSDFSEKQNNGLQAVWITPIRALTKEIRQSAERAIEGMGLKWKVAVRSGDTSTSERNKIRKSPPEILITTPESLHLLIASKGYPKFFQNLKTVVVDEWHELIGSKRGVQMELALSRLRVLQPSLKTWGISATIGNMEEAMEVLLGPAYSGPKKIIRSNIAKKIEVVSVIPEEVERYPWAGHLGIRLLEQVIPILENSRTTLIFTNTRAQCEIWYQKILEANPDLAGLIAMHHSSMSREIRDWVENALHEGSLKAVVCTSSLDLGVDFRPVETIIQIGSPKGVGRFMQRAGRSGHQPGATSRIYFVPTHALELLEAAGLREAIRRQEIEQRVPHVRSFDVLAQYLVTLAVSEGFIPEKVLEEIRQTFCFQSISDEEWNWLLSFISTGGSLHAYDEYKKVIFENGRFTVDSRRIAQRHRLSIGTIVSDSPLQVKYLSGKRLGNIEEWFIGQLKPGDVFWFAGRSLELVRVKDMTVQVRKSNKKTGRIPSWQGGRMPLSSQLSEVLRKKLEELASDNPGDPELKALKPIVEVQRKRSHLPTQDELLIEYFSSREGYHLLIYPFEGRFVHEGLGALLAYRLSRLSPLSFSIAMNDYGFELLSDKEIPIEEALNKELFSTRDLFLDIQKSINEVEMARRRFRDIASIAGLIFKGFPGRYKKDRHLQASSSLLFDVFNDYEPENLLFLQAYEEVRQFQLQDTRLREALNRINKQKIVFKRPGKVTPFAFPILVDRLRERLSSEKLEDRIRRMKPIT
jgi:ATP-dependent Lhr-like helicase